MYAKLFALQIELSFNILKMIIFVYCHLSYKKR